MRIDKSETKGAHPNYFSSSRWLSGKAIFFANLLLLTTRILAPRTYAQNNVAITTIQPQNDGALDGREYEITSPRDGSPAAGSGNCNNCGLALPDVSGSCWANQMSGGAPGGSLYFGQSHDDQVYDRAFP